MDGKVEEAVEEAHAPTKLALGNPHIRARVARLQMLDDAGYLCDHLDIVDEHRELAERPHSLELSVIRLVFRNLAKFERRPVGPERDQCLPGVAAERMTVEFEACPERSRRAHQAPSAILLRSSISAWLGSFVAKLPVSTSPF